MADNLTVSITADSTQARKDIGLLQSSLRELRAEHRRLADELRQGAAADPTRYETVTREILAQERALKTLTLAQREQNAVRKESTFNLREYGLELGHFAHAAGIAVEGIRAIRFGLAGLVAAETIRIINDAIGRINELNNAVRAIPGGRAEVLKSLQRAIEETGQKADVATRAYTEFNKQAAEAEIRQMELGRAGTSGVNVLAGGRGPQGRTLQDVQSIVRGGQVGAPIDWTDPFFTVTGRQRTRDRIADMKLLAQSILNIRDAALQDLATQKTLGVTFKEYEEVLRRTVAGTLPQIPAETEKAKQTQQDYNQLVAQGKAAWDDVTEAIARTTAATAVAITKAQTYNEIVRQRLLDPTMGELPFAPQPAAQAAEPSASAPIPPRQAAGGYIRGAGTGTSDSVPAWLSAGEYVVNARSVSRLGVSFLNGLNRFAEGGFIDLPRVHFANGGVVGASNAGGTPVHLHLGNQVFATTASQSVASALVTEAHRQAITSAGVKPSWYAGRAGAV